MTRRPILLLPALALAVAACGGSSDEGGDSEGTEAPVETDAPDETTAPETTAPTETTTAGINSFDAVQPAVIQIIAQGTFRDPEIGYYSGAGSGSGFVISPDGYAVTNNHVVTGAATLEVYIGGELDDSFNATLVGVSECNDLALIKIDSRDELPHLSWFDGEVRTGLDVYAAGYPLGDPEFTLTRGIVAKAEADGETPWASIDSTIEHDANIQPGNSGGPLVDPTGHVVAVNYAGGSPTNTEQFFAIGNELAQEVVDELRNGDFESLGINGQAILDEEAGITGIWVAGVAPGSPASEAELLPGDIITALNGLPMGTDGTMRDYCDVIRTSSPGRPITVEVLRYDTQEVLRGELYGDKVLEQAFSFAQELEEEVPEDTVAATPDNPDISGYTNVVDDTGQLAVDVPNEWGERDTAPYTFEDGSTAPQIVASPSIQGFYETWDVPGLLFTAAPPVANLDEELSFWGQPDSCTDGGIYDYSDALYTGRYQIWTDCGGTSAQWVVVAAVPGDNSYTAILVMQVISDADLAALDQAFATFVVTPA